jgi:hypothetical protein
MSSNINFSDSTPAAPSGEQNVKWQGDASNPRNISANVPNTGGAVVKTADYTATAADCGRLIVFNSAGAHALTLPAAAPFAQWNIGVQNIGTGNVTISPNGLTIDGAGSSLALAQTQGLAISTDATNYFTERGAINITPSLGGASVKTADYTVAAGDTGKLLAMNSGSAQTITLPASPPSTTWCVFIQNIGTGVLTVNRNGLTIDGAGSNLTVYTGEGVVVFTDGTNYFTERGMGFAQTLAAATHKFLTSYSAVTGLFTQAQPTDADLAVSDVTTNNVSTSAHGFAPKAPNDATKFLDGTGAFSVPAGAVILTTKGDILTFGTVQVRLPVGSNGQVLTSNSSATNGVDWETPTVAPTATTSLLGLVKPDGTTIDIASGVISVPTATPSLLGLVKPDGTAITIASGVITVPTATNVAFGIVKPDGTTVTISAGVLSATGGGFTSYDVLFAYAGAPPNATTLQLVCFARATSFVGNLVGSVGHCGANPTATATYTLYKNAVSFGTVAINTSGTFTFATAGGSSVSFAIGDTFSAVTPVTDATLSNVTMTFHGS